MSFAPFDPLAARGEATSEVAANAAKKEIENILNSYVGWYDPFCELIQNALDSVDEKSRNNPGHVPQISIVIDIMQNKLCVSDNGVGLDSSKFTQFLAPSFSFKSRGKSRGHKGVGATYLAYGFNYIQIATKTPDFFATGKMTGARAWLSDDAPSGNPQVIQDQENVYDDAFAQYDTGVSICLKFDKETTPADLSWIKADTAEQWKSILLLKTGLGAFNKNERTSVTIKVISSKGKITEEVFQDAEYLWPYTIVRKAFKISELDKEEDRLFKEKGADFKIPAKISKLDCIHGTYSTEELVTALEFSEEEKQHIRDLKPSVNFSYVYSTKVFNSFNKNLGIRKERAILIPGIQMCANNMPQGEIIQIPLNRNIGRQNQMSILIHFENCVADLGRKGFQSDAVELAKTISRKIIDIVSKKYKRYLRITTGVNPDLKRKDNVENWKRDMEQHETECPMTLTNSNFFLPTEKISITSLPTREQDVIALFNQLIAGGVIRGIKIMSTNERFTYDGMYRVQYSEPSEHHLYDAEVNPLGVDEEHIDEHIEEAGGYISNPRILEYKYNLDALIEDIENGDKNTNDIDLVVVWDSGKDFEVNYEITCLLDEDNLSERDYHGVTHVMRSYTNGQTEMHLIVLKELLMYLNKDPNLENELAKYD